VRSFSRKDRRVLRVEPVHELPEGDAVHVLHGTHLLHDVLDGLHVDAAVPVLEVVPDDHGRTVAVVRPVEALQQAVAHLAPPRGAP